MLTKLIPFPFSDRKRYYSIISPYKVNKKDSFSDKIEAEMENMIDKLLKELKIEKKNCGKQVT